MIAMNEWDGALIALIARTARLALRGVPRIHARTEAFTLRKWRLGVTLAAYPFSWSFVYHPGGVACAASGHLSLSLVSGIVFARGASRVCSAGGGICGGAESWTSLTTESGTCMSSWRPIISAGLWFRRVLPAIVLGGPRTS